MSREFPDFVDPWRSADGDRVLGGTIALKRMKRLTPLLASDEGEASFELRFGRDEQHRATVDVTVAAALMLVCQRSLEPYTEQVRQQTLLQIIAELEEQALLSSGEDFVLIDEGRIAVADLVEDELLLAVPQVPRNPEITAVKKTTVGASDDDAGGAQSTDRQEGRQRPFESLAKLMKNR